MPKAAWPKVRTCGGRVASATRQSPKFVRAVIDYRGENEMINGKAMKNPTELVIEKSAKLQKEVQEIRPKGVDITGWDIPAIWDTAISFMQKGVRSLMTEEQQSQWDHVEEKLLHQLRLIYSHLEEGDIIDKWEAPSSGDSGIDKAKHIVEVDITGWKEKLQKAAEMNRCDVEEEIEKAIAQYLEPHRI
jgi:hypothetical protein